MEAAAGDGASERGAGPPLELYPSKLSVGVMLLAGLVLLAIGGTLLAKQIAGTAGDEPIWAPIVIVVMAGVLLALMVPMALAPRPILVADARGLHYLPRLGKGESFAWEELAAVGWVRAGKHSGFGLWMRDREQYVAAQPGWQKPFFQLGRAFGRPERRLSVMADRAAATAFAQQIAAHYPVEAR